MCTSELYPALPQPYTISVNHLSFVVALQPSSIVIRTDVVILIRRHQKTYIGALKLIESTQHRFILVLLNCTDRGVAVGPLLAVQKVLAF